jgi:hypothetical protein
MQCNKKILLFDHLVGGNEQRVRHIQAKSGGCLLVDLKHKLNRLLDGQITRISAFQDAISVGRGTPDQVERIHPIGEQSAGRDESSVRIDCWDAVSLSLRDDASHMRIRRRSTRLLLQC